MFKSHIYLSSAQIRYPSKLALKDTIAHHLSFLEATGYIIILDPSGEARVCSGLWFSPGNCGTWSAVGDMPGWIQLQAGPWSGGLGEEMSPFCTNLIKA